MTLRTLSLSRMWHAPAATNLSAKLTWMCCLQTLLRYNRVDRRLFMAPHPNHNARKNTTIGLLAGTSMTELAIDFFKSGFLLHARDPSDHASPAEPSKFRWLLPHLPHLCATQRTHKAGPPVQTLFPPLLTHTPSFAHPLTPQSARPHTPKTSRLRQWQHANSPLRKNADVLVLWI